ncbi:MaoC family dehydratase [Dactylosporangium cerinum]|uniref:MaoC family dehydratase n=1 Tax=Dactylosporangium cerinum TaxID=1434730 RepID=A0ABV9VSW9_9ACTN
MTGRTITSLNDYFEDFAVGDRFVTAGRTITQEDINRYTDLSGDAHPLHTSPEDAAHSIFGRITAQGALTLSLVTGLEFAMTGSEERGLLVFSGMDRVRFLKPVFVDDTIHLVGTVASLDDRGDRGLVVFDHEVRNDREEIVAVYGKRMFYRKRPSA